MMSNNDSEVNKRLMSGSMSLSIGKQNGLAILNNTNNNSLKLKSELNINTVKEVTFDDDDYGF